jgi:S1-C subfamily serine protease
MSNHPTLYHFDKLPKLDYFLSIMPDTANYAEQNNSINSNKSSKPNAFDFPNNKKPAPSKNFFQKIGDFFRLIGIIIILILLATSSLFAFLVINPDHEFSKWMVNNTPLNRILGLNTSKSDNSKTESAPINNLLGLNTNDSNQRYSFAPETSAKSTTTVVNEVLPSVVSILVKSKSTASSGSITAGTGYVVDTSGLVVTNKHVIASTCGLNSASASITAVTFDQKAIPLTLQSVDPINDIAILKMENLPSNLTPVKFADSNLLQLGAEVIAIGNALGELDNTVTKGIISGLNRSLDYPELDDCTGKKVNADGLIQTDAAINRGNSGGPLFDSSGRLIAMNTFGATEGENIGLAIPSNLIKSGLESFAKNNKIARARLGVTTQSIDPLIKQTYELPLDYGEIILASSNIVPAIASGSAAEKAGLKEGDIILEINGTKLVSSNSNPAPLRRALSALEPNTKINLTVLRIKAKNGNTLTYNENSEKIELSLGEVSVDLANPLK